MSFAWSWQKSQGTCKIEDKCKKDQEGPDKITTVNWPDKLIEDEMELVNDPLFS